MDVSYILSTWPWQAGIRGRDYRHMRGLKGKAGTGRSLQPNNMLADEGLLANSYGSPSPGLF